MRNKRHVKKVGLEFERLFITAYGNASTSQIMEFMDLIAKHNSQEDSAEYADHLLNHELTLDVEDHFDVYEWYMKYFSHSPQYKAMLSTSPRLQRLESSKK